MADERTAARNQLETVSWDLAADAPVADGAPLAGGEARYVLGVELGRGATSVVHAATDRRLDRQVAIKLLRPELRTTPAAEQRLLAEARVLAKLGHPNVVTVYDLGTAGDRLFVVMERVSGESLRRWLAARPRGWRPVLRVLIAAGRGLAAAHAAGLAHRDFKPDNVLVGPDVVRVADFGLACLPAENPALAGTPAYMAPELHAGGAPDARADQFSFAVTLFEALYGRRPFSGDTPAALLRSQQQGVVAPPKSRVPAAVRAAVRRALGPAAGRFASMGELLAVLERALTRRRRVAIAGALVATALLAAAAVAVPLLLRGPTETPCPSTQERLAGIWDAPRRAAVERAFTATGAPYAAEAFSKVAGALDAQAARLGSAYQDACQAAGVRHDQTRGLRDLRMSCLGDRREELGALTTVLAHADRETMAQALAAVTALPELATCADVRALEGTPAPPSTAQARALLPAIHRGVARGEAERMAGNSPAMLPLAHAMVAYARSLDYPPLEAEALLLLGRVQDDAGQPSAAATLQDAMLVAERGHVPVLFVRAAALLAIQVGRVEGHYEDGLRWAKLAEATRAARVSHDDVLEGLVNLALGLVSFRGAHYTEARGFYLHALALYRGQGEDRPNVANLLGSLANVDKAQGHFAEALRGYQAALAMATRVWGPDHPALMGPLANLGRLQHAMGDPAGQRALERALRLAENAYGPDAPQLAPALLGLADVKGKGGDLDGALALLGRARTLLERARGPQDLSLASTRAAIGAVLQQQHKLPEARRELGEALAIQERISGDQHPSLLPTLQALAALAVADHRMDDAEQLLLRALAIGERGFGPDHPDLAAVHAGLAELLRIRGAYDEAAVHSASALAIDKTTFPLDSPRIVLDRYLMAMNDLARGRRELARPALEAAIATIEGGTQAPLPIARFRFALARALWATDHARGLALARQALAEATASNTGDSFVASVRSWLAKPE